MIEIKVRERFHPQLRMQSMRTQKCLQNNKNKEEKEIEKNV